MRPVSSLHSTQAAHAASSNASTTWYSVRAGLPASRTAIRVRRAPERPIGASIMPRGDESRPHTNAMYTRSTVRAASCATSESYARAERATTSRPLVSRSSRCTMPGPHRVADRVDPGKPREQPVDERARSRAPRPGCTTSPAGLATTIDVVVGEPHVDRDAGLGLGPDVGLERRLGEHLEHVALVQAVALRDRAAVDEHRTLVDQVLHRGARPAGQERERAIDPVAVERGRERRSAPSIIDGCDGRGCGREQRADDQARSRRS